MSYARDRFITPLMRHRGRKKLPGEWWFSGYFQPGLLKTNVWTQANIIETWLPCTQPFSSRTRRVGAGHGCRTHQREIHAPSNIFATVMPALAGRWSCHWQEQLGRFIATVSRAEQRPECNWEENTESFAREFLHGQFLASWQQHLYKYKIQCGYCAGIDEILWPPHCAIELGTH